MARRHTRETIERGVQLIKGGMSIARAAREVGMPRRSLQYWCRKTGVRSSHDTRDRKREKIDRLRDGRIFTNRPRVLQAVELAVKGLSYGEIAEEMGISRRTVINYMKVASIPGYAKIMDQVSKRAQRRLERRRLMEDIRKMGPETKEAIMRVFGDILNPDRESKGGLGQIPYKFVGIMGRNEDQASARGEGAHGGIASGRRAASIQPPIRSNRAGKTQSTRTRRCLT